MNATASDDSWVSALFEIMDNPAAMIAAETAARQVIPPTPPPASQPCPKCYGRGTIEHFRHVSAGVCFRCNGSGVTPR